jgi:hypothetical protein
VKKSRRALYLFYVVLVAAMAYSVGQLGGTAARASSGTCCAASSQCSGDLLCYAPGDRLACCLSTEMGCKGPGYCEDRPILD